MEVVATIELSEPMRVELLLELSGLTRQEALVIKACAEDSKNFDAVSRVFSWWEDSWEGYQLEVYPAESYNDDGDDDPELVPHEDQDYEEHELDEPEAIALNSIEELDDTADAGHAIQLQLAANAAFGKAKGKGKFPKGKDKGKGKVVRSHLTLDTVTSSRP